MRQIKLSSSDNFFSFIYLIILVILLSDRKLFHEFLSHLDFRLTITSVSRIFNFKVERKIILTLSAKLI